MLTQRVICVVGVVLACTIASWAEAMPSRTLREKNNQIGSLEGKLLPQPENGPMSEVISSATVRLLERLSEYGKWMEGLDLVTSGTRNADITSLSAYIRSHFLVIDVTQSSSQWSVSPIPTEGILVINLLPYEQFELVDGQGRKLVSTTSDEAALFYLQTSPRRLILINPWVISPLVRGLLILRVAHAVHFERFPAQHSHAYLAGCRIGPAMEWARILMDSYSGFGGETYDALLERVVDWYLEGGVLHENRVIPKGQLDQELDKIFGPALSVQELELRRLAWTAQLWFRIYAKVFPTFEVTKQEAQKQVVKDLFGRDWCR